MEPIQKRVVSRRQFMRVSALATAGVALVACGAPAAPAPAAEAPAAEAPAAAAPAAQAPAAAPGTYNEAPMLAELVQAGSLPAVDERLPSNPYVMAVAESTGNYGGAFRRAFKGVSDRWGPTKCQDHGLAWYDQSLNMQARMAESWETNEDASEWTFHLREGQKWSDGTPFTTEAVQYWYDNELKSDLMRPTLFGTTYATGPENTLAELEVVDDYTFKLKFADPNPLFIYRIARTTPPPYTPGHYMSQFNPDLTSDKAGLDAKIKQAGFESWDQYYMDRNWWYMNPERPSVAPWISKNSLTEELFVMERNPYFFAVDAD
ncbi:MAG TPA: ABC transporter substrate-binding protein, partial [Caldilineaceae bacterium]|nr:ABC transporter substrate-binding protein [Caldilineaceae bacterium]